MNTNTNVEKIPRKVSLYKNIKWNAAVAIEYWASFTKMNKFKTSGNTLRVCPLVARIKFPSTWPVLETATYSIPCEKTGCLKSKLIIFKVCHWDLLIVIVMAKQTLILRIKNNKYLVEEIPYLVRRIKQFPCLKLK